MSLSHVPIEPLFLWLRAIIQVAKDLSVIYILAEGKCFCAHTCLHVAYVRAVEGIFVSLLHGLYESACEKHVCLWGRAVFFYHGNDLTQLELRLMPLAFFSVLTCVFVCVFLCVFLMLRRRKLLVGASCDPSGSKVCMFPTSVQHKAKPKTTVHVHV